MAEVVVTGTITPTDIVADIYATHDATYGKGGLRSVADYTERNAISGFRRTAGMIVYVESTDEYWRLLAGPWSYTNLDWQLFASGSNPITDDWELLTSGDLQAISSVTGAILPSADDISDLGSSSYRFKDLYLGSKIDASTYLDIWTNGSSRIYINSSGNVGIGTSTPSVKLHIKGNSGLYIESDDLGYGSFKFVPYSTIQAYSNIKSSDNLELRFGSLGNAGKLGLLNANNTSRFGINTATPNSTLDIIGEDDDSLSYGLTVRNSTLYTSLSVRDDGFIELNGSTPSPSYPDTNVKNAINNGTWHRGGLYIASDIENHSGNITSGEIRMGTGSSINFWAEYSNPADGQYTYGGKIYSSLQALQIRGGLLGTRILGGQTSNLGIHVDLGGKVGIMTDADVYYALKVKGTGGFGHIALFEPNASTDTVMIIKEDGSVGINTNAPLYKLDSRGSFNLQVDTDFYIRQVSLQIHAQTDANNYIRINRDNAGLLDLYASASASMAIASTGESLAISTTAASIRHNTSIQFTRTDDFVYGYWDTVNYKLAIGSLGITPAAATSALHIQNMPGYAQLRLDTQYTPTSSADTNGNDGDFAWDDNYVYVKTGAGWKRAALSSF